MSGPPAVTKRISDRQTVEYEVAAVSDWDGFDSLIAYLRKHWAGEVTESVDHIYSRRWVVRVEGVPISVYHDSQIGTYMVREDRVGVDDLLERIAADMTRRLAE